MEENEYMKNSNFKTNPLFSKQQSNILTNYLFPCFIIKNNNKAFLLWVHSRIRLRGFGKLLVKLSNIEEAYFPLPNSIQFWEKCKIKTTFIK